MTQQAAGYNKAREELILRVDTLEKRIERDEGAIREQTLWLEASKVGLQRDKDLLDGYRQIVRLTSTAKAL